MVKHGGKITHRSDKYWDPQSAENLIKTLILTEQVLLQGLRAVQIDVVLLKDILEQLGPLREAVEQAQDVWNTMSTQGAGLSAGLPAEPDRTKAREPAVWQSDLTLFYSTFPDSKWECEYSRHG